MPRVMYCQLHQINASGNFYASQFFQIKPDSRNIFHMIPSFFSRIWEQLARGSSDHTSFRFPGKNQHALERVEIEFKAKTTAR